MAIAGGNLIKAGIQMGCIVKPETPKDSLSELVTPQVLKVSIDSELKIDSFQG